MFVPWAQGRHTEELQLSVLMKNIIEIVISDRDVDD